MIITKQINFYVITCDKCNRQYHRGKTFKRKWDAEQRTFGFFPLKHGYLAEFKVFKSWAIKKTGVHFCSRCAIREVV